MSIQFNHTIVWCADRQKSADFLTGMLGLAPAVPFGPFLVVKLDNAVSVDFYQMEGPVQLQHYAYLVGDDEFDAILARIQQRKLPYWADPGKTQPGEIYRLFGGRGVYFDDPDGHKLEAMTKPYGHSLPENNP